MKFGEDLLAQSKLLARHEARRPRQTTLRRAVSTAYYALFHLLTEESARFLIAGDAKKPLRQQVQRAFDHGAMRQCCRAFSGGALPAAIAPLSPVPVSPELRLVAQAFVTLQDARHIADYDVAISYSRSYAVSLIDVTEAAFAAWRAIRTTDEARVFLVSLLLWRQWNRT